MNAKIVNVAPVAGIKNYACTQTSSAELAREHVNEARLRDGYSCDGAISIYFQFASSAFAFIFSG